MHEAATTWAEGRLGEQVLDVEPLVGGRTSTMLALTTASRSAVLRLMTQEPWRTHGPDLVAREREAQRELTGTGVPAPVSLAVDPDGEHCGVAAHLMTRLPGSRRDDLGPGHVGALARLVTGVHAVRPAQPFRPFQSWAWEAKWVVPTWTRHPRSWRRAFELLAGPAPDFEPTFLHRDLGHHNLLWTGDEITGVVDWVETSTGPAWLDAAHVATNLAVALGVPTALSFVREHAAVSGTAPERHWLVMDAVGFLPPPGRRGFFEDPPERDRLDSWLHHLVVGS
ncbi:phosphotransferase family protein [Nocardioides bruguierae]|uniref:Aminoglycoside phosphotransferase family protein n=1 Tax=Nocardioides bruguierae TaxID=2945102 RepID=A0A9X2IG79_9ACTN|nr:aminoglycoside phosphotransferase family protein [Nocardioides bruguierae]MCM0621743.1 aminoglycoside phosphotransferase family protein [Nocardioides bruguierae]